VILTNTDEDLAKEHTAVGMLAQRRVDGLIVCPTDAADRSHLSTVIDSGTPVVLLDRRISGLGADTVGIDNRAAARTATAYLIDAGHTRIGVLTGASLDMAPRLSRPDLKGVERIAATTSGARTAGYRDALLEAGITPDSTYVVANGFHREDAISGTTQLLTRPDPPTAILAFDSILSLGALQAVHELGLTCPDDVSLLGFDDAEWADVVSPPLSVMAQPVYEIGVRAARLLLARIHGDTRKPVHDRMPTSIIERQSVAAPRANQRIT